jgi:hypothetical protein
MVLQIFINYSLKKELIKPLYLLRNRDTMKTKVFCSAVLLCLCLATCRGGPQKTDTPHAQAEASAMLKDNATVERLISDYSGMKEDDIVSWAWIDQNFKFDDYGAAVLGPVANYSSIEYPWANKHVEAALNDTLTARKKNAAGQKSVIVTAAITGMHGKPGFLKRFSPSYEDTPSVELELIIAEAGSKRELVKISHMARAADIPKALDKLLQDVSAFLNKKI